MGCTEGFNDPSADPLRSSGDDGDFAQISKGHVGCDEEKVVFKIFNRFLSTKFQPQFVLLPSGTSETSETSTNFRLKAGEKSGI